ncbi:MAG: uracil-DNA glycosylase [Actinobacteria bacterium]|nr:uracil-DNA glycosylase [Actinomycetota bacterium]
MSLPTEPPFTARPDIASIRSEALGCTKCRLAEGRTQVVWADGNLDAELLFIGEAPGFHEDKQGLPFVGAAGQLLDRLLGEIDLDRTKAAIVNVIKCRPPGNRDPLPDEIESCKPYLEAQLAHMRPKVIVTLGNFATQFVLDERVGISRARGRPYQRRGATVVPTFHPAAALRGGRFGGANPIDAIRADFQEVKRLLEASKPAAAEAEPQGEQLGLF